MFMYVYYTFVVVTVVRVETRIMCMNVYAYVCFYICMYELCRYIYIYIYIYIHTYTHTHYTLVLVLSDPLCSHPGNLKDVCVCITYCRIVALCMYVLMYACVYTGCNRRNVRYFGRVFLMSNYTDITQNTYIQI